MQNKFLNLVLLTLLTGSTAFAQEPTKMQQLPVPKIAPDFRAPQKPSPI